MKSFFSRLRNKSGGGNKEDANGSDVSNATPQRGLLDRGLSTSSGHATSPAVGGLEPVRTRLDMDQAARGKKERQGDRGGRDGRDGRDGRVRGDGREARKQKQKREQQRRASQKGRESLRHETPGSPGSVTVGKRSAMVGSATATATATATPTNGNTGAVGESSQSSQRSSQQQQQQQQQQQSEQEYYASLQQAMAASMADTIARRQMAGSPGGAFSPASQAVPSSSTAASTSTATVSLASTIPVIQSSHPGVSVSFLPDTPSEAPDLHVARALAESQFAARQADELQKARDSLFDAAVSKAMEASISTADYDNLLRDMKMWMIDLDAMSDDVVSELTLVRKREDEISGKIERALEKGDTHRLTRLLWEQENLPEVKRRIEALQETMVPVGIASSDLLALRQRILASYPPVTESQKARDRIIDELFTSLKGALANGPSSRRAGSGGGDVRDAAAGPSVSSSTSKNKSKSSKSKYSPNLIKTSEDCQDSSDLRCLIVGLVDDAKKIPRAPESIVKEAKSMVRNAFKEQQASVSINLSDIQAPDETESDDRGDRDGDSESKTEVSSIKSTATELQSLIRKKTAIDSGRVSVDAGDDGGHGRPRRDEDVRTSSNKAGLDQRLRKENKDKLGMEPEASTETDPKLKETRDGKLHKRLSKPAARTTDPRPFNLSKSRAREQTKTHDKKGDLPPIRRVPAFFSLTHELLTDNGIVSQSVDWQSREYSIESLSASKYHTVPAPVNVDEFYSEDVHELLSYVKKHYRSFGDQHKSATLPTSSKDGKEEKWYTMVEVAGAVEGLLTACESFLTWRLPATAESSSDAISASCHDLKRTVNQTLSIIADTAYAHDTLRVAVRKHRLPWDETLISQVRWDAQHAASIIMQAAIDCAEDQERKRGFKRSTTQKSVLKPLGQAVIATFAVHQLSGGFGGEAALICDQLVDLCVHYARQLDPKWFRGTKVVNN